MFENNPFITVITVTYNSAKFVKQTIESVLAQSYQNFEYIIIDDCSTDNTWQLIQQYKDSRIISFKNETNLSEYPNRNKAIKQAKGKYIFFVDGDDVALNRGIELAVIEMEQHNNCGFGIVKLENPKFIGPLEINSNDGLNVEFFGGGLLNSSLANNVYKTSVLQQHLFLNEYKNADTYTRISLLKTCNVLVLINPICLWRLTINQESKKISYSNQLLQQIQFIKDEILQDPNFVFFAKQKLKPRYYKLIYALFKQELFSLRFANAFAVKKYFTDSFITSLKYFLQKSETNFWSEYNYENLNININ